MNSLESQKNKLLDWDALTRKLAVWRFKGKKIVFTNGVFDLLHPGHVTYLSQAKDLGNLLVVGLNADASVKRLGKGDLRPLQDQGARAIVLAGLQAVDAIVLFDEDTPFELIKLVQPDVLVKGGDDAIKDIVGHDIVAAKGGETVVIPFLEGHSTTNIENKIKNGEG